MLESLASKRSDIRVRKVDINRPGHHGIDWGSPLAKQYVKGGIPYFQIYDAAGSLLAEGPAARPIIRKWCSEVGVRSY